VTRVRDAVWGGGSRFADFARNEADGVEAVLDCWGCGRLDAIPAGYRQRPLASWIGEPDRHSRADAGLAGDDSVERLPNDAKNLGSLKAKNRAPAYLRWRQIGGFCRNEADGVEAVLDCWG